METGTIASLLTLCTVHTPELVCVFLRGGNKMVNPVFMASECGVEEAHNRLSEKDMSGLHNPNQTVVALW
jgi:hypothetical protein